ncbi:dihydropteroate synthase [Edaphobacter sp. 4G125]|nr:dihydropteroate synthase [Edaphobacter sp. 4G125]
MGILNVTPDSFSDGGHFYTPEEAPQRALEHALSMLDQGADIIDIGGESTRPGATPLSAEEEQTRVMPVIEAILRERPQAILSIDTFHAGTAQRAIEAGAEIVNDVSGHLWDQEMAHTCARLRCGSILMHARGKPSEWRTLPPLSQDEVMPMILKNLSDRIAAAEATGIERDRIVIDPGIGFGKRLDENFPILAHLEEMHQLGLPILVGASRKSFLVRMLATQKEDSRLNTTTAANVAAVLAGAHIVRVHDVQAAIEATSVADRLLEGLR